MKNRLRNPRRGYCTFILITIAVCAGHAGLYGGSDESPAQYPAKEDLDRREDLQGDIAADRALSAKELDLLLRLSDLLIDTRANRVDRGWAARDLGILGHKYAIPALVAVLRDESDNMGVRQRAATALSMIRDKRTVEYLISDGLGSNSSFFATEVLSDLVQFAGRPPELADASYRAGVKPPPKDPVERKKYLETWHQWWKKNRDKIKLNRSERFID